MAKAKPKPRAKPKPAAAVAPPPPPPPAPVEVAPAAEERDSRRATIVAIAIAVLCACFTGLLLSGWTPGPNQSAPPRIAAKIAPAAPSKKTAKPKAKTPAPAPAPKPKPKPAKRITAREFAGELFVAECGFCHTLSAVGTKGTAGPNLDQLRPTEARVLNAIAAGGRRTGLMPPGIYTGADARRVAKFVAEATRR